MRAMKEVRTQGTVRRRPAPPHAIRASAALAGFATVVLAAAAPSPHARTAAGAPAPEAWRRVRTLEPLGQEAGAIGAAVAVAEGVVWSGTARDADVGDGPTAVQAVVLRAGFGFPTVGAARIAAPSATASIGLIEVQSSLSSPNTDYTKFVIPRSDQKGTHKGYSLDQSTNQTPAQFKRY